VRNTRLRRPKSHVRCRGQFRRMHTSPAPGGGAVRIEKNFPTKCLYSEQEKTLLGESHGNRKPSGEHETPRDLTIRFRPLTGDRSNSLRSTDKIPGDAEAIRFARPGDRLGHPWCRISTCRATSKSGIHFRPARRRDLNLRRVDSIACESGGAVGFVSGRESECVDWIISTNRPDTTIALLFANAPPPTPPICSDSVSRLDESHRRRAHSDRQGRR